MTVRLTDETDFGFGWIEEAAEAKTGHALVVDGRVWLVDPIEPEDVEERVLALGEPAGVLQLLDRHNRAAAALAARLGVPHHVAPRELPGTPFTVLPVVRNRTLEGGRALVAGAARPRLRRRARDDPVLPRGRRAGRRPPRAAPQAAARTRRPRPGAPARRARRRAARSRHRRRRRRRGPERASPDPALAARPAADRAARLLARAGQQPGTDEPRRRLQPRVLHRRVQRLRERRGPEGGGSDVPEAPRRTGSCAVAGRGRSRGSAPPSPRAASPARARSRRSARSTRS